MSILGMAELPEEIRNMTRNEAMSADIALFIEMENNPIDPTDNPVAYELRQVRKMHLRTRSMNADPVPVPTDLYNDLSDLTLTVPAGKYWITDPCYVTPRTDERGGHDLWLDFCDEFRNREAVREDAVGLSHYHEPNQWVGWTDAERDAWHEQLKTLTASRYDYTLPDGSTIQILSSHTAEGDGSYSDGEGRSYWVDAGLIGAVPYDSVGEAYLSGYVRDGNGANVVDMEEEFAIRYTNGIIQFVGISGKVLLAIDTGNWDY